jgi:hypothetical protein
VFAAGIDHCQDIQVRIRKEPAFRLPSGNCRDANNRAKVLGAGNTVKVLDADSGEPGDLFISEKFLTRFYGDHIFITRFRQTYSLSDQSSLVKN